MKKNIKENAPVLQLDPLFFEETNEHAAHTLLDIPRQIREMIRDDMQPSVDLDDLKNAAELLELDWLVQILQNPEAQSVADLFVYNEFPKINISSQRCDLSNRNLVSLAGMHFYQGLFDLRELDLMGNKIRHSMQDAFDGLKNLEMLDLKGNEICDIGSALALLRHLKVVDLRKNNICDIQNAFGELQNLMFLDLRENEIREICSALNHLRNLKRLDLGVNKIRDIEGVFNGPQQLIHLDLSYNRISQDIPGALPDTIKRSLTFFSAKGNHKE
jgi:Leucine-rich repeat (LRR) protein